MQAERTGEEVSCGCRAAETDERKYWQLLGESVSDQWWRQLAVASTTTSTTCHVAPAAATAAALLLQQLQSIAYRVNVGCTGAVLTTLYNLRSVH